MTSTFTYEFLLYVPSDLANWYKSTAPLGIDTDNWPDRTGDPLIDRVYPGSSTGVGVGLCRRFTLVGVGLRVGGGARVGVGIGARVGVGIGIGVGVGTDVGVATGMGVGIAVGSGAVSYTHQTQPKICSD